MSEKTLFMSQSIDEMLQCSLMFWLTPIFLEAESPVAVGETSWAQVSGAKKTAVTLRDGLKDQGASAGGRVLPVEGLLVTERSIQLELAEVLAGATPPQTAFVILPMTVSASSLRG